MSQKVAFVGVGRMGANMARHLQLDCGHDVTAVYDINREAAGELAQELGAANCEKLAEVTAAADVVITVITNDDAMRAIFFGEGDNLLQGAEGTTFINCATLSPGVHREVYLAGKAAGADVLEGAMASRVIGLMRLPSPLAKTRWTSETSTSLRPASRSSV